MNDLISVIIPIYKVEKYIKRCVDSVLNQTYKNLEIILVDDGSPDDCPKICDDYAKKDKRIKVIHKTNGGLSDARNVGIDNANGKYITFVDSDDYVECNYIDVLYKTLKKYNVKMSIADNLVVYEDKKINTSTYEETVFSEKEVLEKMLWGKRDLDNGAWTKLYEKSLFNDVKYPVGRLYEDTATTYKLFNLCDRIAINSVPIYNYMKRRDSITQCKFNENKLQLIDSTIEMTNFVKKKYPDLKDACNRKLMWAYLSTLSQYASSNCKKNEIKKQLINSIKQIDKSFIKNENTPKRDKLALFCLKFGFNFYKIIWKIYLKITKKY